MKPSLKKQLLAEIDAIHAETGSTGPEGYALLRRIANGNDREHLLRGYKEHMKMMAAAEAQYRKGDREAALTALVSRLRMVPDFPLPRWLADFLEGGAYRFTRYESKTLDEAFEVSRKTGFNTPAAQKRQRIGFLVRMTCDDLIRAGRPVDDELFEVVGEKFSIGKTTAKKYFYDMKPR